MARIIDNHTERELGIFESDLLNGKLALKGLSHSGCWLPLLEFTLDFDDHQKYQERLAKTFRIPLTLKAVYMGKSLPVEILHQGYTMPSVKQAFLFFLRALAFRLRPAWAKIKIK